VNIDTINMVMVYGLFIQAILLPFLSGILSMAMRLSPSTADDPQLGRKILLHMFFSFAVMLVVGGLIMVLTALVDWLIVPLVDPNATPSAWNPSTLRVGIAVLLSGVLQGVVLWLLIRFATNDREYPAVGRRFNGFRLGYLGLLLMCMTTWGMISLASDPVEAQSAVISAAMSAVLVPACGVHVWAIARRRQPTQTE
jgi:hypothetical protein